MKIKEQIMGNLFGDIDVSIFFKRIQKIYPDTKYFNPFNPSYSGFSMTGDGPLDGIRIDNVLSGIVMSIGDKDVSSKNINVNINLEVYRIGKYYLETIYTSEEWNGIFRDDDNTIVKNDKNGELVSIGAYFSNLMLTDLMPIGKIGPLTDKYYNYGSPDFRKVDNIIHKEFGVKINRIGKSFNVGGNTTWSRTPYIVLDDDKKIAINDEKDKKVSDKYDIYEIKDKGIYLTTNSDTFDKACQDIKKDFISIVFVTSQHNIAKTWFDEIEAKSKVILESIDNENEVYWQNLRMEIEGWQLKFLTYHSKFYKDLSFYFNHYLTSDDVFTKKLCDEWEKEFNDARKEAALLYDEVKYALNNLATPGHTHDEQLLQKETEKVNERILLLSFLAMSIPMIGAVLTPALSLNLKLISGFVVLLLPVLYMTSRKLTFRRNKNLNTKSFLKIEAKNLNERLENIQLQEKEFLNRKDIPDDMKKYYVKLIKKSHASQSEKLDKMNKKIKSL